jgi:hypothetical protein
MPPADRTCEFAITDLAGGDLKGPGFGPTTGKVRKNQNDMPPVADPMFVKVTWDETVLGPGPATLTGRFMFSMSPTASVAQKSASPFLTQGPGAPKQICYMEEDAPKVGTAAASFYRWGPFKIDKHAEIGKYELTVVLDDGAGTNWSEDPEFDVEP